MFIGGFLNLYGGRSSSSLSVWKYVFTSLKIFPNWVGQDIPYIMLVCDPCVESPCRTDGGFAPRGILSGGLFKGISSKEL